MIVFSEPEEFAISKKLHEISIILKTWTNAGASPYSQEHPEDNDGRISCIRIIIMAHRN